MRKIKAAVLGAGLIGKAHIEAIRRLGYVEVVAIGQSTQATADQYARELHVPKAYGNYIDLLNDEEIEVIHNCTPNHMHFEMNKQALLHGKHLLSEKPMTLTSEEAKELYLLAEEKQLATAVNFVYRQFPMVQHLKSMVTDHDLGDIRIVQGHYLQDWLFYQTDYNWRMEPMYGGETRAISDIGSHLYDLVQYVTGLRITEVLADSAIVIPQRFKPTNSSHSSSDALNASLNAQPSTPLSAFSNAPTSAQSTASSTTVLNQGEALELIDIKNEDYCAVLVKFNNGARGVLTVSQVSAGKKNALGISLDGSIASGAWEQEEPCKLTLGYRDKPGETVMRDSNLVKKQAIPFVHYPSGHVEGWADSLKNMMHQFYGSISNQVGIPDSVASFKEGYQIMLINEAIVQSAKSGTWVSVIQV
ncbi:Gfo/Idh/MocA family oxidoreductase [Paenibacillus agricola]|uniref:Gfo/Idh/MocA family oxidoreductase n=1 Tax=Paenibacillus agricola TaxID=2716264 RepID=A0ABX0J5N0_9BACL|nr:Gfo/Idh/MocA family oxidoreductase [Paenibacillus agricola]NHN31427.1 Gfo/Idh/MocA family oxidoreductase [Paenibacillus agricola]